MPRREISSRIRIATGDSLIRVDPRELALRELARRRDGTLYGEFEWYYSILHMLPELPISDRADRRVFPREVTSRMETAHFLEQAFAHHRDEPRFDARVQCRARRRYERAAHVAVR